MPVAAEWGYQPVKEVYDWFNFISRQYEMDDFRSLLGKVVKNEFQKPLLIKELRKADFNISDIYIKNMKINERKRGFFEKILAAFGEMEDLSVPEERPEIRIVHENLSGNKMDISLDEDSSGTSVFMRNISELIYLSMEGGLMIEDELGKTYHTKLTQHFIDMVKRSSVNSEDVQLLFSSHNTKVLNLLNPDQIYLVDKDEKGITRVELLDDYNLREDEDIVCLTQILTQIQT